MKEKRNYYKSYLYTSNVYSKGKSFSQHYFQQEHYYHLFTIRITENQSKLNRVKLDRFGFDFFLASTEPS